MTIIVCAQAHFYLFIGVINQLVNSFVSRNTFNGFVFGIETMRGKKKKKSENTTQ